ncbi:hypothetical protein CRYUN_Cryun37aG0021300 [Craigia yunnanensis]
MYDSRFTRQELPACKPILTPRLVITTFTTIGIIFIPIGLESLSASEHVVEIVDRYDEGCVPLIIPMISLHVPKLKKSPVFICYQLDNFYQNHRRKMLVVNKKNIAWDSDKEHKFGSDVYPKNFQTGGLIGGAKLNVTIPDLIVWMRTAALPTFRKLYGRIEDLPANEQITVVIQNNYNTYSFGGKKKLVLSTTSWIGGKNDFLGIAYITIGGLCLFLAVSFILLYVIKPRALGDPSYLSLEQKSSGQS